MEVKPLISINYELLIFLIAFLVACISGVMYLIRKNRVRKTSIDNRISNLESKVNKLEKK